MRFFLVVTSLLLIVSCKPDKPVYVDSDDSINDPINGPNSPKSRIHDLYTAPNALKSIGKPTYYQTENLCKLRDCLP